MGSGARLRRAVHVEALARSSTATAFLMAAMRPVPRDGFGDSVAAMCPRA
jgi:hypothetical protein